MSGISSDEIGNPPGVKLGCLRAAAQTKGPQTRDEQVLQWGAWLGLAWLAFESPQSGGQKKSKVASKWVGEYVCVCLLLLQLMCQDDGASWAIMCSTCSGEANLKARRQLSVCTRTKLASSGPLCANNTKQNTIKTLSNQLGRRFNGDQFEALTWLQQFVVLGTVAPTGRQCRFQCAWQELPSVGGQLWVVLLLLLLLLLIKG